LRKIVFWSEHKADTLNVLEKENIKRLYRVDVINVGFRKTVRKESLFLLFLLKNTVFRVVAKL
jgi:hypothetical protein